MLTSTPRRAAATGIAAAVVAGLLAGGSPAFAEEGVRLSASDSVLYPGAPWLSGPVLESGTLKGTLVYAFSTRPLDGSRKGQEGVSALLSPYAERCERVAGATTVFTCAIRGENVSPAPHWLIDEDAPDLSTVHFGYAYVPQGGNIAGGVEDALSASTLAPSATRGAAKLTVKTAAHAALNSVAYTVPNGAAGRSVTQKLTLTANDEGRLLLRFRVADGQPVWPSADIRIKNLKAEGGAQCELNSPSFNARTYNVLCTATPGTHHISYTLTVPAGLPTWQVEAHTAYKIYTGGEASRDVVSHAGFTVGSGPRFDRHRLLARDSKGSLFLYEGTGYGDKPFKPALTIGSSLQTMTAAAKLEPVAEDLDSGSGRLLPGRGDLVARDSAGVLWLHPRKAGASTPFAPRARIGAGWNIYDALVGTGDLTGDRRSELLARDKGGVLWLYPRSTKAAASFGTRVRVGAGWSTYTALAGGADLTGDRKADLLARDKSGTLWLHPGSGKATAPFLPRVKVGARWNAYDRLTVVGDLTNDGKADAVARNSAGVLWLYKGTGKATSPFTAATRIGAGWNTYDSLL
ncbi:VCBS repeat-containing protein [Streptomyces sp. NPDC097619]|uniref:FG-GAP repeat domain-containing protein n=1 Tax=Streptomyces sp. NPDC097619 TaxID=3157228 RepID=UPI00332EDBCB